MTDETQTRIALLQAAGVAQPAGERLEPGPLARDPDMSEPSVAMALSGQ